MISDSMATSNTEFEKYIADYTEMFAGIKSNTWTMCSTANATYTDCPIPNDTDEFAVTSYNPSTLTQNVQTFKVPPMPSYDVKVFNYSTKEWNSADSTLLCYEFIENNA